MSYKQYQRGTQLIRRQHDEQTAEMRPALDARAERHWLAERCEKAESRVAELESLLLAANAASDAAATEKAAAVAEFLSAESVILEKRHQVAILMESSERLRRQWAKASRLLRMMPPELVREARESGLHR